MVQKNIEAIYPLSPSQKGILLETLAFPDSCLYLEQSVWEMRGNIDTSIFKQAWQKVVDRHQVLRTFFVWKNQKEPVQVVLKKAEIAFDIEVLLPLSPRQQQEHIASRLEQEKKRGFQLDKMPLLRWKLFQLDQDYYQLIWSHHHILIDGWCLPLIWQEVIAFYEAISQDRKMILPPAPSYRNYINWLKQKDLNLAKNYWQERLVNFRQPTVLGMVEEASDLDSPNSAHAYQSIFIDPITTAHLQSLIKQHRLTLNTLIRGIWGLLLASYSCSQDVVFGATVAGRPSELQGSESILGLFINTIPIRLQIGPEKDFWSWLKNLQAQDSAGEAFEYCSSGQIQQWSEIPSGQALYESILVFENYPVDLSQKFTDFNLNNQQFLGAHTKYTLTILVIPSEQIEIKLVYDGQRIFQDSVALILAHWPQLSKLIVNTPNPSLETLIGSIPPTQIPKIRPPRSLGVSHHPLGLSPRTETEGKLVAIWRDVLNIEAVGIEEKFLELGGHSLAIVQVMERLQDVFPNVLTIGDLFEYPTIAALGAKIDTIAHNTKSVGVDLSQEILLADNIPIEPAVANFWLSPQAIFLTGSTGFLGIYLLAELLEQTSALVYCLVRGKSDAEGLSRLEIKLQEHGLWQDSFRTRIIPVVGDLSQPLLGLTRADFDRLAQEIDVIYHNGALVNFIYPYAALKSANVLGTVEIIRLASQGKTKPVHFISTLAVFSSLAYPKEKTVLESNPTLAYQGLYNGYAESKWVAEKLMTRARERGLPVNIYRPGTITGHSQTGIFNPDDLLSRIIQGCIEIEAFPDLDMKIDMVPVDYISKAITYLSQQPACLGHNFHLVNPHPINLSDLAGWIQDFGYRSQRLPYTQWCQLLLERLQDQKQHLLYPFLPLFKNLTTLDLIPPINYDNTLNHLGDQVLCPPVDSVLLDTYFRYFVQQRFFGQPVAS
jgi:thioester reductase-like protein